MSLRWRASFLWLIVVALAVGYLTQTLQVTTDISEFLPHDMENPRDRLIQEVASGELTRQMVLTIEVPEGVDIAQVSRDFDAQLRSNTDWLARIETLNAGNDAQSERAIWKIYAPRWMYFFAPTAAKARQFTTDAGLRAAAKDLRGTLAGPMSALAARMAPTDPFLVLTHLFQSVEAAQAASVTQRDGRFVTSDGRYAVIFVTTRAGAFQSAAQKSVLHGIHTAFHRLNTEYDRRLRLEMSGVNRIAVAAQQSIQWDIQRISLLSSLLLCVLLWCIFGGLRVLVLALMSIGTGMLMAICACNLIFGHVQGICLAFGASLIGLAVDYTIHLYSHHAESAKGETPRETLHHILPALLIAATSTLMVFFALGFTGFPGLRQVSVFAVTGLGSALCVVGLVAVHWMPARVKPTRVRAVLLRALGCGFEAVRRARWPIAMVLVIFVAVIAWGLPHMRWSDTLVGENGFDAQLMAEEARVRARVSRFDQSRFIASTGPDLQSALESADRVADLLRTTDLVGEYASISRLLPSKRRQRDVAQVLREDDTLETRFQRVFGAAGFRTDTFQPFYDALDEPPPPPLSSQDLEHTPLATLVDAFVLHTASGVVVLTPIRAVRDAALLQQRVGAIDGAVYIDESQMMGHIGAAQRRQIALTIGLGLLAVCGLLWWRYRRVRVVFSALLPSLLAVLWTWSILAIIGEKMDLITVAFSLLIVALGVDYGVFLIDTSHARGPELRSSLLGVAAAGMTTLIGFGLLALSSFPMLYRVGLIAVFGVSAAMCLSPIALMIAAPQEKA